MGDESSSGRTKLPGKEFVQSFRPQGQELKARHVALKQKLRATLTCYVFGVFQQEANVPSRASELANRGSRSGLLRVAVRACWMWPWKAWCSLRL